MHSILCKYWYMIWTLPNIFILKLRGIQFKGLSYFGGRTYATRQNGSSIVIGKGCRFMSKDIGNLIGLNHRCILATGTKDAQLYIGDNCSFSGVSIWCFKSIRLGNNVRVGANVTIMDGDAHQNDPRAGVNKAIEIEDNVWIGSSVTILKGVHIGRNSLIGAGSIVTKDIPENSIAVGNPCKVINSMEEETIKQLEA